ncbi:uncharacterized protein LOC106465747 isoform X2 [Limulus polyphemus]|uniref:Uncharacterized protein LOC106465747 isoform X2 n=1 Tax=Limulus polyphemus TaxID=6850 RepID=A0ABM1T0G4_LIMPO|nr:uncharacterized protein LOC106465747 isoform X2 [Limulus polyphemus]
MAVQNKCKRKDLVRSIKFGVPFYSRHKSVFYVGDEEYNPIDKNGAEEVTASLNFDKKQKENQWNYAEQKCKEESSSGDDHLSQPDADQSLKSEEEITKNRVNYSLNRSTSSSMMETKSCSPPPKPPRRRHSGKSLTNLDPESSVNLKKLVHRHNHQKYSMSENSESESLDSYKKNKNDRQSLDEFYYSLPARLSQETSFKKSNSSPRLEKKQLFCSTPLCKESRYCSPSSTSHSLASIYYTPLEYRNKSNHLGLDTLWNSYNQVLYPLKRSSDQTLKTSSCGLVKNGGIGEFSVKGVKGPFHRRHHSDPLIPWDEKQSKNRNSKRSRSFVESDSRNISYATHSSHIKGKHLPWAKQDPEMLMEEIRMLEEINDKLWQKLQKAQAEVEILRKTRGDSHQLVDYQGPGFAELLGSIYYAQKERDQAVNSRLRLANQERDQTIEQLRQTVHVLGNKHLPDTDSCDDEDSIDLDLNKILDSLETTRSPPRLLHNQEALLASVHKARVSKQHQLTKEFNTLLHERNTAIEKTKLLEQEVVLWSRNGSSWKETCEDWEANLKETVRQATEDRDSAMSKYWELAALFRDQQSSHLSLQA